MASGNWTVHHEITFYDGIGAKVIVMYKNSALNSNKSHLFGIVVIIARLYPEPGFRFPGKVCDWQLFVLLCAAFKFRLLHIAW